MGQKTGRRFGLHCQKSHSHAQGEVYIRQGVGYRDGQTFLNEDRRLQCNYSEWYGLRSTSPRPRHTAFLFNSYGHFSVGQVNISSLQRQLGTGDDGMTGQWLGALVLAEDSCSVFRTHMVIFNHP